MLDVGFSASQSGINTHGYAAGSEAIAPAFSLIGTEIDKTKIIYDPQGGICEATTVLYGEYQRPEIPSAQRHRYVFKEWNTKSDGSGQAFHPEELAPVLPGKVITLYAIWERDETRDYVVKHYQQNVTLDGYTLVDTEKLYDVSGSSVTPDLKHYIGFIAPAAQTVTVAPDDSTVVEYYYDRGSYTVRFDRNGGTSGMMENQTFLAGVNLPLSANTFSKEGALFTGWNTEPDGSGTGYTNKQSVSLPAENGDVVTLYAQWLDNSDHALDPTQGIVYVTAKAGQTVIIPDLPAGTKYTIEEIDTPAGWEYKTGFSQTGTIGKNEIKNTAVTNKYMANGQVDIIAHKKMEGRNIAAGEFAFQLLRNGAVIDSKTNEEADQNPYIYVDPSVEGGDMIMEDNPWYGTAPVRFNTLYFTQADIGKRYTYTIKEVVGSDPNVNYDAHTETVTIRVTDAGGGMLDVQAVYDSDGALFTNTLKDGSLTVSKAVTEGSPTNKDFTYSVLLKDQSGNPLTNTYPVYKKLQNYGSSIVGVEGIAYSYTQNLNADGTKTSNYGSYWNNSNIRGTGRESADSQAHVVTIDGATHLTVTIRYGGESDRYDWVCMWEGAHPTYTATSNYSTSKTWKLGGGSNTSASNTKVYKVDGDTVTFAFKSDSGGYGDGYGYYAVIESHEEEAFTGFEETTIQSGGTLTLKPGESFEISGLPDGATYEIIEQDEPGWSIISDTGSKGTITAGSESTASFVNAYNAEGSAIITATKHLAGGSLEDYTFNFELLDENMQQIQFKQNDALGNVIFDPIYYKDTDSGKTFTYYIREIPDPESIITFDDSVYTVNVAVQDNGQGELVTQITYPDGEPVFENSAAFSITVGKTVGGSMGEKNKQFRFELELTGDHVGTAQMTYNKGGNTGNVTLENNKYAFTLAHDETITISGIPAGSTYTVTELDANKNAYLTQVDAGTTGALSSDVTIGFTNTRDVVVPTGRNAHPIIPVLIFGLGSALGAGYIIKKKRKPQIIPIDYE